MLGKICGHIAADEGRHEIAYQRIVEKFFELCVPHQNTAAGLFHALNPSHSFSGWWGMNLERTRVVGLFTMAEAVSVRLTRSMSGLLRCLTPGEHSGLVSAV